MKKTNIDFKINYIFFAALCDKSISFLWQRLQQPTQTSLFTTIA